MASTDHELATLAREGVPHVTLVWTAYFFSLFSSKRHERHAFRRALMDAGFTETGTAEEATGDGHWHHWSHTIRPADPEVLREADRLAAEHGVRYDEWMVTRDDRTGQLRAVSP